MSEQACCNKFDGEYCPTHMTARGWTVVSREEMLSYYGLTPPTSTQASQKDE